MNFKSYNDLFAYIADETLAFNFAIETSLIKLERTCECSTPLCLEKDLTQKYGWRFRCISSRSLCRKSYSLLHGTWFWKSKLSIRDQILAIYAYGLECSPMQLSGLLGINAKTTTADWSAYFRDICAIYLSEMNSIKIGGEGLHVEIDESKIFKNKNHIGRLTRQQETREWVFGGICRETKETFFEIVNDRREETLKDAIERNVERGSHIISDQWRSYQNIQNWGYLHSTINHSESFISPEDDLIHTQTIERCWRGLKENIERKSRYESRASYMLVYSFKRRTGWYNMNHSERFNLLIGLISSYY